MVGKSPLEVTTVLFWVHMVQPGQHARKSLVGRHDELRKVEKIQMKEIIT